MNQDEAGPINPADATSSAHSVDPAAPADSGPGGSGPGDSGPGDSRPVGSGPGETEAGDASGSTGATDAADPADSDKDSSGFRLPGRADILSAFGRLAWRRRNARAQRLAGMASAQNAVRLEFEPEETSEVAGRENDQDDDDHAVEPFVPDPQVAAFFDVDNTLIQGASIILLARGLAKHKFFTANDVASMAWTQLKFRVSGKENAEDVAAGREKALSFIEGRTVTELMELSEEVVDDTMLDRVWPGTRALVQMHLDAGQQVWLVTATPVELARVIAKRLGLSGALGTVAEDVDGVYTGRLVGDILHGPGKAHAINALAESEGFDLSKCYAYSDSFNDMPMLTMVGNPAAINPDARLRNYASENGWEIKDFRTVRKAAKKAFPGVIAVGGVAGATAAARSQFGVRALGRARRRAS